MGKERKGKIVKCSYCEKEKYVPQYTFLKNKYHFCNKECQTKWIKEYRNYTGENNPNWKNRIKLVKCDYCGNKIEKSISLIEDSEHNFCNYKCKGKWQSKNIIGDKHPNYVEKIEKPCFICGKICYVKPHKLKNKILCSKKCRDINKTNIFSGKNNPNWKGGYWRPCEICGKKKWILPSRDKVGEDRFCSKKCFSIWMKISGINSMENNPRWLGGISFEKYSVEFNSSFKLKIRERDNFTCQLCGAKEGKHAFDCHHIDYDKKNNIYNNLILLCKNNGCHQRTNNNRDYWKNYFQKLLLFRYGYRFSLSEDKIKNQNGNLIF